MDINSERVRLCRYNRVRQERSVGCGGVKPGKNTSINVAMIKHVRVLDTKPFNKEGQFTQEGNRMHELDYLKSKYCFHPPETAIAMLIKDGYKQSSRKNRRLASGDLVLTEVPEPIMMLIRKRSK